MLLLLFRPINNPNHPGAVYTPGFSFEERQYSQTVSGLGRAVYRSESGRLRRVEYTTEVIR